MEITSPDNEILAMMTEEFMEALYVMKLDPNAILPERKIAGAARYDISPIHTYIIEAGERELISTGLAIAILEGYYGRIAPDSGVAWQKGIQIGAGVIDNDFRGEVKILVFNMIYGNRVLNQGEAIAQVILEKIATPEVVQLVELPKTIRGTGGFGSTTEQHMNPKNTVANPIDTSHVQIGTPEWENLMNKLVSLNSAPSTSQQQLHVLTTNEPAEWINPFYAEGDGYDSSNSSFYSAKFDTFNEQQMIAHMDLEEELELDYPIQKQSEGIFASSSVISKYNPPEDTMMGPPHAATSIMPENLFVLIGEPQGWQVQIDIPKEQYLYYYWGVEAVIAHPPPTPYDEKNLADEEIFRRGRKLTHELLEDLQQLPLSEKGKEQIVFLEEHSVLKATEGQYHQKRAVNRLYNMTVIFEIPNITSFSVNAILDTCATSCCIDKRSVPAQALEENSYTVLINGVNSKQSANWKLKGGQMLIGKNKFRIPFTYSFEMTMGEGNKMVLGCNFIRSMQGGVRIEGNSVTFYKNITSIATNQHAVAAIEELELDEMEYLDIEERVNFEHIDGKLNVFADTMVVLTEEGIGGSAQFPLLTEYKDLMHDTVKNILLPEEHQKRRRMKEIEDQAIQNASLAISELELIQQMEYDFNHKRHLGGETPP
ncbi:hypothetical protein ZIOFF_040734 [Zingiber officinale]|uniref:dUTP diphosphatase n=1 Tax=Zingiber officinale TaxID=94328 RepID=A0A8J5L4T6_ZINOF|nr:hypothetical protein ZIOFF_040734 [Zingiber officinale]